MKKGELLAEIDAKDFEIQARTDSAEIDAPHHAARAGRSPRRAPGEAGREGIRVAERGRRCDRAAKRAARSTRRGARSEQARRNIGKAKVVAPLDGEIERQAVAEGDYVKVGDLLFTLVGTRELRALLPLAWQGAPRGLRGCAPR